MPAAAATLERRARKTSRCSGYFTGRRTERHDRRYKPGAASRANATRRRIIEARRNPVPGGGFVLIFADFTERKRAEEAIRSARDAAESALRELQTARASLVHAQKMAALRQGFAGGDFDGIDPPLPRSTILRFSDCARSMVAAADFPISRIPAGEAVDSSRLGNPDGSSSCPKTTRYAL